MNFFDFFTPNKMTTKIQADISSLMEPNNNDEQPERLIKYGYKIAFPNNWKPSEISFDDVDSYDFTKGFNEFLIKPDFVHLYFDFDTITNEDEYKDTRKWLDKVGEVFGPYSVGGYSNDEAFASKYGFRYLEGDRHFVSMHVVYFKTMIEAAELVDIMKHTDAKGFWRYEVNEFCDFNVYKLVTRQAFRHALSDKIFNDGSKENKQNHGYILNGLAPSTQIVQVKGNELPIPREQWEKVFPPKITKTEAKKLAAAARVAAREATLDDIQFDTEKLILFDADDMSALLSHFDTKFGVLEIVAGCLVHSPYPIDFVRSQLLQWYGSREHNHDPARKVEDMLKYYEREHSNRWFFSLLKHLPKDIADQYRERVDAIDHTINLNSSTWTLQDIKRKSYDIAGFAKLINDLRGVIGFVDGSRWFIKTIKNDQTFVHEMTDEKCFNSLRYYKPFRGNNKITLEMIVKRYSMQFAYDGAEISKDNKEGIINLFQGFKYVESMSNDFEPLQPFLNHVREVICNNDDEKYAYIMKWWANIFQNVTVKNGTMPIIHGAQGSGKSFLAEVFCELLGNFACKNVDDMDKVFGKFNSLLTQYLVIIINEPPDANEKFKYLNKIKAKLTQVADVQERKGVDQIEVKSFANYLMTSNNSAPVQEEKGDRRLIYFDTNNKYCGDEAYFDNLCKPIQPVKQGEYDAEFMSLLLHYMRTQIDVTDFNPERLIREISKRTNVEYNEQLERQYADLNNVDKYVVDNYQLFAEEYNKDNDAWEGVRLEDISVDGYKSTGIAKKLNSICTMKRKQVNGHRTSYFKLKPREQIPDLWAIIDYIHYGDEEA